MVVTFTNPSERVTAAINQEAPFPHNETLSVALSLRGAMTSLQHV